MQSSNYTTSFFGSSNSITFLDSVEYLDQKREVVFIIMNIAERLFSLDFLENTKKCRVVRGEEEAMFRQMEFLHQDKHCGVLDLVRVITICLLASNFITLIPIAGTFICSRIYRAKVINTRS